MAMVFYLDIKIQKFKTRIKYYFGSGQTIDSIPYFTTNELKITILFTKCIQCIDKR